MPPPERHLLLVRHGETDWNAAGRLQGQTDVPLNANGRAQALALASRLRAEGVRAIGASDLSRARGTAEIVGGALGLEVALLDADLRERGYGAWEGLTRGECAARHPEAWARHVADPRTPPPGGETAEALLARVVPAIHRAAERLASPAVLVTHGGVMRAFLSAVLDGGPVAGAVAPRVVPNGGVWRVRLVDGRVVGAAALDGIAS
ncbi:histidine phosphatase family protein [Anaeromyxobacter dehalogenans]|uniref:Phosphoglycerate mutase n=1 Tax=Anaeromyxobacter dehalogenans (strain 2CP-C) TaxID=290397 RepID=Q2IDK9_ANADE|nr:histidine phosphatase family protein [Anaeromyxobacter dehalogenans]ABC82663.1 phosphoglycerate mutase [Anaeromyxobacter dehalogenans 2CP-C]